MSDWCSKCSGLSHEGHDLVEHCLVCGGIKPELPYIDANRAYRHCSCRQIPGRATTPEQKRAITERLLALWLSCPMLRLGQLVYAGTYGRDFFSAEDEAFITGLEQWAKDRKMYLASKEQTI